MQLGKHGEERAVGFTCQRGRYGEKLLLSSMLELAGVSGSLRKAAQWARRSRLAGSAYYLPEQLNSLAMGCARA